MTGVWTHGRFGGASRARTDGLVVANDALSQLSYSPTRDGLLVCEFILPAFFHPHQASYVTLITIDIS